MLGNNAINQVVIEDEYEGVPKTHVVRHLGPLVKIDEIDASEFDANDFETRYFQSNRPLVIRGALKRFDCGSAVDEWRSLDYLKRKCGSNRVYVRRNTLKSDYKIGKAYLVQELEFAEYVRHLEENSECAQNSYLAVQNLRKAFPQIADELRMPPMVEKLHAGPFLWIARPGHYEYDHMDPDDNLLMVIRGRKLVRLYGCDVDVMMPNKLGSKGRTIQSQIDCDNLESLPSEISDRLRSVECQYCLLKETDLLYTPAFWWHQVKSPELTVSVNVFFGDAGTNRFTSKLFRSPNQLNSFMYWLKNIIKQNMSCASFPRILVNLRYSLESFLMKQWHEVLTDQQMDYVYSTLVEHFALEDKINELGGVVPVDKRSKNPPVIKIRGLLQRPKKDANNDRNNNNNSENSNSENDD